MSGRARPWLSDEIRPLRLFCLVSATILIFSILLGLVSYVFRESHWMGREQQQTGQIHDPSTHPMGPEPHLLGDAGNPLARRAPDAWMSEVMRDARAVLKTVIVRCGQESRRRDPAFSERIYVSLHIQFREQQAVPNRIHLRPETTPHFRGCLQREVPQEFFDGVEDSDWPIKFELTGDMVEWQLP